MEYSPSLPHTITRRSAHNELIRRGRANAVFEVAEIAPGDVREARASRAEEPPDAAARCRSGFSNMVRMRRTISMLSLRKCLTSVIAKPTKSSQSGVR
jgi:hypothetical protein